MDFRIWVDELNFPETLRRYSCTKISFKSFKEGVSDESS